MGDTKEHHKRYWDYEYQSIDSYGIDDVRGLRVLDAGCGEGGALSALYDLGASCVGVDTDSYRVGWARRLSAPRDIDFVVGDVAGVDGQYDLILLRDVIEHIGDKKSALRSLRDALSDGGKMLVTFPPFYSAFGGHQHTRRGPASKIPFAHIFYPKCGDGDVMAGRLGMSAFEHLAPESGLTVLSCRKYLLSPNLKRMGVPTVGAGPLGSLPLVSEFICTGVVYLMGRENDG